MASKESIKELVALAIAEDRELAEDYLAELGKHGIAGSVKVCDGYGRVKEAMLYVQADRVDDAYWIVKEKQSESCCLGVASEVGDDEHTQAA